MNLLKIFDLFFNMSTCFTIFIGFLSFIFFKLLYRYIDNQLAIPETDSLITDFDDARKFLVYGYPEIKSLSIQFLTLLAAILVFSVTFSEKIINFNQTKLPIRLTLAAGWSLLILAVMIRAV